MQSRLILAYGDFMALGVTITLEKVYRKLERLERDMAELKHSILPAEKLSKKELREIAKTSTGMDRGKYLSAEETIALLDK